MRPVHTHIKVDHASNRLYRNSCSAGGSTTEVKVQLTEWDGHTISVGDVHQLRGVALEIGAKERSEDAWDEHLTVEIAIVALVHLAEPSQGANCSGERRKNVRWPACTVSSTNSRSH